jgi:O-methyltransferase
MAGEEISDVFLEDLCESVKFLAGDFAEIGVLHGLNFKRIAPIASRQGKLAHAFDSFCGMDNPGAEDGEQYPKGRLSNGGVGHFLSNLGDIELSNIRIHQGYIPDCFVDSLAFSFAFIDVDHNEPTMLALEYVWARLPVGGIILLDDYFPGRHLLCSIAIDQFLVEKEGQFNTVATLESIIALQRSR